jgi:methyltransferase family protein
MDLAPVQPPRVPLNCSFEVDNMELDWTFSPERFDFIHCRDMIGLQDPEKLLRQSYDFLKPGGWVEISSTSLEPRGDGSSNMALKELSQAFHDISVIMEADPNFQMKLKSWFEKQGFVNVKEVVLEIPCSLAARKARVGRSEQVCLERENLAELARPRLLLAKDNAREAQICHCEQTNILELARSILPRGWKTVLGKTEEEFNRLATRIQNELIQNRTACHLLLYVYIDLF